MEKKEEKKKPEVKADMKSIDYRKSYGQPILCPKGVLITVFQTKDKRRGVSVKDIATGKNLVLAGEGKLNEEGKTPFYAVTEVEAIKWTKETATKTAVTV